MKTLLDNAGMFIMLAAAPMVAVFAICSLIPAVLSFIFRGF